jgi:hypothetical protein
MYSFKSSQATSTIECTTLNEAFARLVDAISPQLQPGETVNQLPNGRWLIRRRDLPRTTVWVEDCTGRTMRLPTSKNS